jgi:hypothetical protein
MKVLSIVVDEIPSYCGQCIFADRIPSDETVGCTVTDITIPGAECPLVIKTDSGEVFFSATLYTVYVESSTARKFEENIAPSRAFDVILDFIIAVANGKIEVKESGNE